MKWLSGLRGWKNAITAILSYIKDNPIEMVYDPSDDETLDEFKVIRFLIVQLITDEYDRSTLSHKYVEFDQRLIAYQLKKNLIE